MKHYEVVAAVIRDNNHYLCTQRGQSKYDYVSWKYEFPGGKIEQGETRSQALMRELQEEMNLNVVIKEEDFFMTVNHVYPDFSITMHAFLVDTHQPNFTLNEHVNFCWANQSQLKQLDWAPADMPIVEKLLKNA